MSPCFAWLRSSLAAKALMLFVLCLLGFQAAPVFSQQQPTEGFEVHPDLQVALFAAEPMLSNPTNIDVDHRGRVWVCEAVNYRNKIRNGDKQLREAGDRILILEDQDGDGSADMQTVFYQGRDIDSAHGICVLGDRALVSAGDSMFFLIDNDGDDKADDKQLLFTGISGVQHDHGIHAAVFGPDGKLYFNFGNEGKQLRDADGKPIIDRSGNEVRMQRPYQMGMIFRCNLDGSELETLAWNFRNNWEVCVDSFGRMWQSDNDDDGNRGVRINYVIPFGNYGYADEINGSGWRSLRTNLESEIPLRHWHLNDPGVVPNLLQTGAGSPTGICVYEGSLLPQAFQSELIHTDAGPNIVRAYPVTPAGAGFSAESVNIMDGAQNSKWFRPSDACIAPDGSVFVADWYDPGVGGHRMQDIEQGRIYRITPKSSGTGYSAPAVDFSTPENAASALASPNLSTRYLAWQALRDFGDTSIAPVLELAGDADSRVRARALWLLGRVWPQRPEVQGALLLVAKDENADIRATVVRIIRQLGDDPFARRYWDSITLADPSPAVRSELAISLSHRTPGPLSEDECVAAWARLASKYEAGDRWELEVLGIAAEGRWDACLEAVQAESGWNAQSASARDLIWRSRGTQTAEMLAEILLAADVTANDAPRYLRSFDFLPESSEKESVLARLVFSGGISPADKLRIIFAECALRLKNTDIKEGERSMIIDRLRNLRGTKEFVGVVQKFSLSELYSELVVLATNRNGQLAVSAINALAEGNALSRLQDVLTVSSKADEKLYLQLLANLSATGSPQSAELIEQFVAAPDNDLERRRQAVAALGKINRGARLLLSWVEEKSYDAALESAIVASLHSTSFGRIRDRALQIFPLPNSKGNVPLPNINQLERQRGNRERGAEVFGLETANCKKCHMLNGVGGEIGPDLSEIGAKLSKRAMFESILYPSAGISHNYENHAISTLGGEVITGLLISETDSQLQIKNAEGQTRTIVKDEIDEREVLSVSLMPAGVHEDLSVEQLVDLVEYLISLKKRNTP